MPSWWPAASTPSAPPAQPSNSPRFIRSSGVRHQLTHPVCASPGVRHRLFGFESRMCPVSSPAGHGCVMGRQLRTDEAGAWHHVMNRGAGRRTVFKTDADRESMLGHLAELDDRFGLEIHAYCLMDNHFHLLVRSRGMQLSAAMQWMMSSFTKLANGRRGVDGAIFRGRFHSVRVCDERHLDWLFRYINANPLDLGWAGRLVDYPWSSLARSIGKEPNGWLRTDYVRSRFAADPARLEHFVETARTPTIHRFDVSVRREEVEAAAAVASAPGPEVHSSADVRAVAAVVWADRVGASADGTGGCVSLNVSERRRIVRARARIASRPEMQEFELRVRQILEDPTIGHLVSDTD